MQERTPLAGLLTIRVNAQQVAAAQAKHYHALI